MQSDRNDSTSFELVVINLLNVKLNPICHLLALLGAHHILHVSRTGVKNKALYSRKKESYFIYLFIIYLYMTL